MNQQKVTESVNAIIRQLRISRRVRAFSEEEFAEYVRYWERLLAEAEDYAHTLGWGTNYMDNYMKIKEGDK